MKSRKINSETPKRATLDPQTAIQWFDKLRARSERIGGDPATKFQIRYMFKYADTLMRYQVPMEPINIDEDGHYFECPRCKQAFRTEYTVDDFIFCQQCGQRFRKEDEENADNQGV